MPRTNPSQLDMFGDSNLEVKPTPPNPTSDARPLPLIVADNWGFPLQHHILDGIYWFSVNDWLRGVAQLGDVRGLIAQMKRRAPQLFTSCKQLKYLATNSKTYQGDFATDEGLYSMVQRLGVNTGASVEILKYLVKSGVLLDKIRRDKDAAIQHVSELDAIHGKLRKDSIEGRNGFTAAAVDTHYLHAPKIGMLTNENYKATFGLAKRELCRELGLPEDAKDLRDHLNNYALMAINMIETHAGALMRKLARPLTDTEQVNVGRSVADKFRPFFEDAALEVGQTLTAPRLTDGK